MKYRKLPVEIDAVQFTGYNYDEIAAFAGNKVIRLNENMRREGAPEYLIVDTLEGHMTASPGDYIIRGVEGEYYPCKPSVFKQTYEEVNNG